MPKSKTCITIIIITLDSIQKIAPILDRSAHFFLHCCLKNSFFNMKLLQYKPNEGSIRYNSKQVMIRGRKTQLGIISVLTCARERRINENTNTVYDGSFPHIHVFDEECLNVTACSFWPR